MSKLLDRRTPFESALGPAQRGGGFAMDMFWIWCGSVIAGPDGLFHMFASRWPRALTFSPHWVTSSEIVRATARRPEGPYRFAEVVLPPRGPHWWDGRMTHNPTIHRARDGTYLLFYTGTTYDFDPPAPDRQFADHGPEFLAARANQRIGLATAPHPSGPWSRPDRPVLLPRPGFWDGLMTTNPAPCVLDDGSILLAYKSTAHQADLLRYGMARATGHSEAFERICETPILDFDAECHVEDAYLWRQEGQFNLIMKDMTGGICGEPHAGVHATSADAVNWTISVPAKAYSRTIRWDDGVVTMQGCLERPQLLVQDGVPTHLFAATADGPGGFRHASRTWNLCVPLTPPLAGKGV